MGHPIWYQLFGKMETNLVHLHSFMKGGRSKGGKEGV